MRPARCVRREGTWTELRISVPAKHPRSKHPSTGHRATKAAARPGVKSNMLAHYAAQRDQSVSTVAQAATAYFLSPHNVLRQEAALARHLDRIHRYLARTEQNLGISAGHSPHSSACGSRRQRCLSWLPMQREPRSVIATRRKRVCSAAV